MRIREEETHLTLNEHGDDDDREREAVILENHNGNTQRFFSRDIWTMQRDMEGMEGRAVPDHVKKA